MYVGRDKVISREEVVKIARLANLDLTDVEIETMRGDLDRILGFVLEWGDPTRTLLTGRSSIRGIPIGSREGPAEVQPRPWGATREGLYVSPRRFAARLASSLHMEGCLGSDWSRLRALSITSVP